jgi:hypothetical protein
MRRRPFLKLGLWGSALLGLGGTGLALFPSRVRYQARGPLRVLDPTGFNVLAHVAARVIPLADAEPERIAEEVDRALALGPDEAQEDFRKLLKLVENGLAGLLLDGRPSTFTRLSPTGQDAALLAMRDSRLVLRRSGYHALRKLCAASYYARESTWAAVGYPGPPAISVPT